MNQLNHLDEFKSVLQDYHMSEHALTVLNDTELVLLLAPSSSGRNTIISKLVATGRYYFIVSDTTRKQRSNNGVPEQDGKEYWFRSEADVLKDIKDGEFLEAEIIHSQQVSGISIRELEKALATDKIAITDIDLGGVQSILSKKPNTHTLLILPPSFDEWKRRIFGRGEMSQKELIRRLQTALRIFDYAEIHQHLKLIVNDDLESATRCTDANVTGERQAPAERQTEVAQLLKDLKSSTEAYLATLTT